MFRLPLTAYLNDCTANAQFELRGSFETPRETMTESADGTLSLTTDVLTLSAHFVQDETGVISRRDTVQNRTDRVQTAYALQSKFALENGEYEVYTQYSNWQNESRGEWTPLVHRFCSQGGGVRHTAGGVPFVALWNKQTGRGLAFHLIPSGNWEFSVTRVPVFGYLSRVEVCLGYSSEALAMPLKPGETVELPEILCYEFRNRTDMDCDRLHRYMNHRIPRKTLPVMYNTWLCYFDRLTLDDCKKQAKRAAALGAEYFTVDAGWFGTGKDWSLCIGDWQECQTDAFYGQMAQLADYVRQHGMKFGLWVEIERAVPSARIVAEHPEYFRRSPSSCFIAFEKPEARAYAKGVIRTLIQTYGIEYFKFDFNANLWEDTELSSFYRYHRGHKQFMNELKAEFPTVYFENCASGGNQMHLGTGFMFDSIWLSDNQSAYEGMRIFKDTLLRLPPQWIEKWAVYRTLPEFGPIYDTPAGTVTTALFTTENAVCDRMSSLDPSWVRGFSAGSPLGISCDLTHLSDTDFELLKTVVAEYKTDREFWRTASCRILTDTDSLLILGYSNDDATEVRVWVFGLAVMQDTVTVYPPVDPALTYRLPDGTSVLGRELETYGISIKLDGPAKAATLQLTCL